MPTKATTEFYIPRNRSRWVEWIDESDPDGLPFRARVRANLTYGEVNELVFGDDTKMAEVHAKLAPFVLEWNAGRIGADGEPEPVPAPADGDPTVFEEVPNAFFWWLFTEIKINATKQLDPKSSMQPAIMAVPTNGSGKESA